MVVRTALITIVVALEPGVLQQLPSVGMGWSLWVRWTGETASLGEPSLAN